MPVEAISTRPVSVAGAGASEDLGNAAWRSAAGRSTTARAEQ